MIVGISKWFIPITIICLMLMFLEFIYSIKKKDSVYSVSGTKGNFLDYIITNLISSTVSKFYFTYFFIWFSYLGYIYGTFNFLSLMSCFVIMDFLFYVLHYLKHKIKILWIFHYVHHSDDKFNLSTFLRTSWVEQLLLTMLPIISLLMLGFNPYTIILSSYLSFIFQFITHSKYIKFPHFMNYLFITPQTHAVHHDQVIKHQNNNFGAVFNVWDRLFGTYTDKINDFTPGIKNYHQDNFIMMQIDPIISYFKKDI